MKLKKGILFFVLTFVLFAITSCFGTAQATTATSPITLSIKALRNSGQGYKVENNGEKYIWNSPYIDMNFSNGKKSIYELKK